MTKLTAQQKRTRTRRRNAAKRRQTPLGRLCDDGADSLPQIRRRLLWFAQLRGIPVAGLPAVKSCPGDTLLRFTKHHGITLDWLLTGRLSDLRAMLKGASI